MHRLRTRRRTAGPPFRSSIRRALAQLYNRRGDIEDLIWCLECQVRRKNSGRLMVKPLCQALSQVGKTDQ